MKECPAEKIVLGPTTRSLLPAMYKVEDFKPIDGVGAMTHFLLVSVLRNFR